MSVLTTAFVDLAYEVATASPPLFEQHFSRAYACASLDDSEACACWPLFNVRACVREREREKGGRERERERERERKKEREREKERPCFLYL
jgi:hypothetical protein